MPVFSTTYEGQMLFSTTLGEHTVMVDSPLSMGGADRAPTSPQLFVASLGSCIATFVLQYCLQTGINCEGLSVDVAFEPVGKPVRFEDFSVTINLPHGEVGERRQALERVVEQCPIHLTMEAFRGLEIEINDAAETPSVPSTQEGQASRAS